MQREARILKYYVYVINQLFHKLTLDNT